MPTQDPDLAELIRRALDARLTNVHTALVGTVIAFNSSDNTADIQPGPSRAVLTVDNEVAYEPLPAVPKVPVLAYGTERSFVQIALKQGDSVLLLVNEASAAEFLDGADATQPGDLSRFGLSSCLAFPFVRPGRASGAAPLALLSDVQALVTALQTATAGGNPLTFVAPTLVGTAEVEAK
jgi:hypothetical protein